jgi:hypothetical protein
VDSHGFEWPEVRNPMNLISLRLPHAPVKEPAAVLMRGRLVVARATRRLDDGTIGGTA